MRVCAFCYYESPADELKETEIEGGEVVDYHQRCFWNALGTQPFTADQLAERELLHAAEDDAVWWDALGTTPPTTADDGAFGLAERQEQSRDSAAERETERSGGSQRPLTAW